MRYSPGPRLLKLAAPLLGMLCTAGSALAQGDQIDQNQPSATAYMAAFSQTSLAQSFQQANGNISGAGIFLYTGGSNGSTITISLWDALPNKGGNQLTSASAIGTTNTWVDVFWNPELITPGQTYYLVFESSDKNNGIWGDTNNPYPGGQVYANSGYGSFPTFDYTFRTWFNQGGTQATETIRVGSPPNPQAFNVGVTTTPIIGKTWDPIVDHTTFMPAAFIDLLVIAEGNLNLTTGWGTLLVDPSTPLFFYQSIPAGTAFQVAIPNDLAFEGLNYYTQAASGDGTAIMLTNAIDVLTGSY